MIPRRAEVRLFSVLGRATELPVVWFKGDNEGRLWVCSCEVDFVPSPPSIQEYHVTVRQEDRPENGVLAFAFLRRTWGIALGIALAATSASAKERLLSKIS